MSNMNYYTGKTVFNVLSLFGGIGGGSLGFSNARSEYKGAVGRFKNILGIDVDPQICQDYERITGSPAACMDLFSREQYINFHGHEPPEDWREVTPADIRDRCGGEYPDVVFTSPPCLLGHGEVLTPSGPRRIDSIRANDLVLTHRGRYRKVAKVGSHMYKGEMTSIRLNGTVDFQDFTAEHPMWVRRVTRKNATKKRELSEPAFIPASEVKIGDRIGFPVDHEKEGCARNFIASFGNPQEIIRGGRNEGKRYAKPLHKYTSGRIKNLHLFAETYALWFLIGAYLGDGYRRAERHEVMYCVGPKDGELAQKVRQYLSELGLNWNEDKHGGETNVKIRTHSRHLCQIVGSFGDGAENKSIPYELMHLEESYLRALLDGYRATDGSEQGRRWGQYNELQARWKIPSVSLSLLRSLQRLLLRIGIFGSIHKCWPGGEQMIEGRIVQTKPRYEYNVREEPKKRTVFEFIDDVVWVRVREINRYQAKEQVWNLEVEEDNTFCAPMMATHNCKGFSGLLPEKSAKTQKYQALNALTLRGIKLCLEAFADNLPSLFLLENVPRITTRGKRFLDEIKSLLHKAGYATNDESHDCGEIGGLAQHRKRYLLIARHEQKMPAFVYRPEQQRVKSIGEVLEALPLPGNELAGKMHKLPNLQWKTWVRLALIPAGGDWRDLEKIDWQKYRITHVPNWDEPSETIIGTVGYGCSNSTQAVSDPRLPEREGRHPSVYQIVSFDEPSPCVTGTRFGSGAPAISDPRTGFAEGTHTAIYRVLKYDSPANTITGAMRPNNGAISIADPRLSCKPRSGTMGVQSWDKPAKTIIAAGDIHAGAAAVADPRVPGDSERGTFIIIAEDGTWHRPLTTLELAILQGFPPFLADGSPFELTGNSDARWRERIGNAVPPQAAQAIGEVMLAALMPSQEGIWTLGYTDIWVAPDKEESKKLELVN